MQRRLQARAFERVRPTLQPGEVPIVAARATARGFASGRLAALVSGAIAAQAPEVLGSLLTSNRNEFVVLTNRRLIFLVQTFLGGPGRKVLGAVPLEYVWLAEAKIGVVSLLRIAFGTQGDGVALVFPRVDQKNAKELAAALARDANTTGR